MIYTFAIEDTFFNTFKNDINGKDARTIFDFINNNFIKRENFFILHGLIFLDKNLSRLLFNIEN